MLRDRSPRRVAAVHGRRGCRVSPDRTRRAACPLFWPRDFIALSTRRTKAGSVLISRTQAPSLRSMTASSAIVNGRSTANAGCSIRADNKQDRGSDYHHLFGHPRERQFCSQTVFRPSVEPCTALSAWTGMRGLAMCRRGVGKGSIGALRKTLGSCAPRPGPGENPVLCDGRCSGARHRAGPRGTHGFGRNLTRSAATRGSRPRTLFGQTII